MPRRNEGLQKHTLNLYAGDFARLQGYFPENGAGEGLRELLHQWLEAKDKEVKKVKHVKLELGGQL